MTKLTDEQIIEKLKELREGDVLIGAGVGGSYVDGKTYKVFADEAGDLLVENEYGNRNFVNIGKDFERLAFRRIKEGDLRFEESAKIKRFIIDNAIGFGRPFGCTTLTVTIKTDEAGFERLQALEKEVADSVTIARLREQKADIERQISEIESGGVA